MRHVSHVSCAMIICRIIDNENYLLIDWMKHHFDWMIDSHSLFKSVCKLTATRMDLSHLVGRSGLQTAASIILICFYVFVITVLCCLLLASCCLSWVPSASSLRSQLRRRRPTLRLPSEVIISPPASPLPPPSPQPPSSPLPVSPLPRVSSILTVNIPQEIPEEEDAEQHCEASSPQVSPPLLSAPPTTPQLPETDQNLSSALPDEP